MAISTATGTGAGTGTGIATGQFADHTGYSDDTINETEIAQQAINPSLRPVDWQEGPGQFPSFQQQEKNGYSGYLERKSDDRKVSLQQEFNHSEFDQTVDTYLLVARVAWHANGAGDQKGISTNEGSREIPGGSANGEWGTVRLPIDQTTDPRVQLEAIYGSGYLWSGTSVVRIQDITIVPAESVGTLSDDEILEITSTESEDDSSERDSSHDLDQAINPSLRPVDWQDGHGQFPSFQQQEKHGYSGYLERKSDDRRVSLKQTFDHSDFDQTVDEYLLVARVAWHANGAGDQQGIKTNTATRDIPGGSANGEWGTVRLPIDHTTDPSLQLKAIYGSTSVFSGTSVVRIQDLTIVPAESVGTLSDDEILERTADDSQNTVPDEDQKQFEIDAINIPSSVSEGQPVTATVSITNGPDRSESQAISLDIPGIGTANGSTSLNPGQSTQLDLTVPTTSGDAGTYDVTASTDADSISRTITVESSPEQNTENETASEPVSDESQSDQCQPGPGEPQMQAVQLYTDNTEIEQGDPGRITGSIATEITNSCPIRVQLTLQVPNGISVNGGQDIQSGSGGLITSTFVVDPGEVKGISADVTSSGSTTGTKQVQSSITYFPVDHQNLAKRQDTGTLEFMISEPESQDTDRSSGSSSTETPGFTPITALIACLCAGILFGRKI